MLSRNKPGTCQGGSILVGVSDKRPRQHLRLAAHLYTRISSLHPEEEGRYVQLRKEWAGRLHSRFFLFFQAQGLLATVLSLPFLLACIDPRPTLGPFEITAAALLIVSLAGEAMADRQLARFKADPASRGRTCRTGLWRYSRHPNYFFEVAGLGGVLRLRLALALGLGDGLLPAAHAVLP